MNRGELALRKPPGRREHSSPPQNARSTDLLHQTRRDPPRCRAQPSRSPLLRVFLLVSTRCLLCLSRRNFGATPGQRFRSYLKISRSRRITAAGENPLKWVQRATGFNRFSFDVAEDFNPRRSNVRKVGQLPGNVCLASFRALSYLWLQIRLLSHKIRNCQTLAPTDRLAEPSSALRTPFRKERQNTIFHPLKGSSVGR